MVKNWVNYLFSGFVMLSASWAQAGANVQASEDIKVKFCHGKGIYSYQIESCQQLFKSSQYIDSEALVLCSRELGPFECLQDIANKVYPPELSKCVEINDAEKIQIKMCRLALPPAPYVEPGKLVLLEASRSLDSAHVSSGLEESGQIIYGLALSQFDSNEEIQDFKIRCGEKNGSFTYWLRPFNKNSETSAIGGVCHVKDVWTPGHTAKVMTCSIDVHLSCE